MDVIRRVDPRAVPVLADPEADDPDSAELPMFEVRARRAGDRAVAGDPPVRSRWNLWFAGVALMAAAVGVTGALLRDSRL